MTQETAKERIYREALEILRGMGINSKNRVMMPYGVAVTAQEFIEEKLEDAENMPSTTDKLSVEKLQEIRLEELKDFNSKILQAELKNQKLQKEIDAAKKYIEESYKADKEDNKLLDLIIEAVAKLKSDNETLKKALKEIVNANDNLFLNVDGRGDLDTALDNARDALAAIGGDDGQ